MALDFNIARKLIEKAEESEKDERIFQQWTAQLPIMAFAGTPISFKDYKERVTGKNIDIRPTFEILEEINEIEKIFQEGSV